VAPTLHAAAAAAAAAAGAVAGTGVPAGTSTVVYDVTLKSFNKAKEKWEMNNQEKVSVGLCCGCVCLLFCSTTNRSICCVGCIVQRPAVWGEQGLCRLLLAVTAAVACTFSNQEMCWYLSVPATG
jgi:hypothetical protein